MNNKLLLIPTIILVFLLVAPIVSAGDVSVVMYFESTNTNSLTINNGDSFGFSFSANSLNEQNMNIVIDFLDSGGNLISNIWTVQTLLDSYNDYSVFTQSLYPGSGNYTIRATVTGASGSTDTYSLNLEVLGPTSGNNAPVITSTPTTSMYEEENYSYQITATDADGDALTYSMTQGPTWLSVDGNGLLTGTAPDINGDYTYAITIEVSDGTDFARQSFSLLVRDADLPDTTAPFITVISPTDGQTYGTNVLFEIATNEDVDRAEVWFCGLVNPAYGGCDIISAYVQLDKNSPTSFSLTRNLSDGTYNFAFMAMDLAGNYGLTNWMTITVDSSIQDTIDPVVTIISPVNGSTYSTQQIDVNYTATDANLDWCAYEFNGQFVWLSTCNDIFTVVAQEGRNTLTVYAIDTSYNVGSQSIEFYVDFGKESDGNHKSKHVSDTSGEEKYLSQFEMGDVTEDEEVLTPLSKQSSLAGFWTWLFAAGVLIVLIAVIIVWIRR